jgi:hypothetical protein
MVGGIAEELTREADGSRLGGRDVAELHAILITLNVRVVSLEEVTRHLPS